MAEFLTAKGVCGDSLVKIDGAMRVSTRSVKNYYEFFVVILSDVFEPCSCQPIFCETEYHFDAYLSTRAPRRTPHSLQDRALPVDVRLLRAGGCSVSFAIATTTTTTKCFSSRVALRKSTTYKMFPKAIGAGRRPLGKRRKRHPALFIVEFYHIG